MTDAPLSAGSLTRSTEDYLKVIYRLSAGDAPASTTAIAERLEVAPASVSGMIKRLAERGWLEHVPYRGVQLTGEGRRVALRMLRRHRLIEAYLVEFLGYSWDTVHNEAERLEHAVTDTLVERMARALGHPNVDPHGDPIPDREGVVEGRRGTPLSDWPVATPGRIVHLEDEPPLAYAQLTAQGLRLGQVVRIIDATPARLVLTDGENEYVLAPMLAGNVHVAAIEEQPAAAAGVVRLSDLPSGTTAQVVALDPSCRGFMRRRLLDLGFTPGARVRHDLSTFAGDPRAYRLRGTTIALRRDQSDRVLVRVA